MERAKRAGRIPETKRPRQPWQGPLSLIITNPLRIKMTVGLSTTSNEGSVNSDREALRALRAAMLAQIASDVTRLDRLAQRTVGGRA